MSSAGPTVSVRAATRGRTGGEHGRERVARDAGHGQDRGDTLRLAQRQLEGGVHAHRPADDGGSVEAEVVHHRQRVRAERVDPHPVVVVRAGRVGAGAGARHAAIVSHGVRPRGRSVRQGGRES
jgi:hypothetical protein